jgi:hypothetical protein
VPAPSATATNSAAAITPGVDSPDEIDVEKAPATDAPMVEAEHILIDYLSLLPKRNLVTSRQ